MKNSRVKIYLPDSDIKSHIKLYKSEKIQGNQLILWTSFLENHILKVEHKAHPNLSFISEKNVIEHEIQDLQILDQNIYTLNKKISLHRALFPTNYLSELDTFVSQQGDYNPVFTYNYLSDAKMGELRDKIEKVRDSHAGCTLLKSEFATLLYDKLDELSLRLSFIEAYKKQDFKKIALYNKRYYGALDPALVSLAEEKVESLESIDKSILGKLWPAHKSVSYIQEYLAERGIGDVSVEKSMSTIARISVSYTNQKPTIRLSGTWRGLFREKELEAKLAHEIDVHLMRYLNGRETGWYIMSSGTAGYIKDEEGLAIYEANKVLEKYIPNYENLSIYQKYHYLDKAQHLSFKELAELMVEEYDGERTLKGLFLSAMRLKKGTQYTKIKHRGTIYIKDKVYLEGYLKIKNYVEKWWEIDKRLMRWKIKLEDINKVF